MVYGIALVIVLEAVLITLLINKLDMALIRNLAKKQGAMRDGAK